LAARGGSTRHAERPHAFRNFASRAAECWAFAAGTSLAKARKNYLLTVRASRTEAFLPVLVGEHIRFSHLAWPSPAIVEDWAPPWVPIALPPPR
jgi:hypothetical protein